MVAVTAKLARPIGYESFIDLKDIAGNPLNPTTITPNRDGAVTVDFADAKDGTPLVDAATLEKVRARLEARTDTEAALRQQLVAVMQANRDYLTLASPNAAQTTAQVKSLTQQVQALIRIAVDRLDGTD